MGGCFCILFGGVGVSVMFSMGGVCVVLFGSTEVKKENGNAESW